MRVSFAAACCVGLLSLLPRAARADAPKGEPSAADTLFDRGLADMNAGRYATGCPAMAESYRLDPQPGALFTLAECEAAWGKTASALEHYEAYLRIVEGMTAPQKAEQGERPRVGAAQADVLRSLVPRITIRLAPSSAPGTSVRLDDRDLSPSSLGVELSIDPGEHVIVMQPPGGPRQQRTVQIAKGERLGVVLEPSPPAAARAPESPPPRSDGVEEASGARRRWAYAAGGVGIAGLAVGLVAGGLALGQKGTVDDHCADKRCDDEGLSAVSTGQSMALVSTVGFVVGAAGLVAGGVLFATSGARRAPAEKPSVSFAFGPGSGRVVGQF